MRHGLFVNLVNSSPVALFCPTVEKNRERFSLPAQTTAMFQSGEKQEGLAKCKPLWDP